MGEKTNVFGVDLDKDIFYLASDGSTVIFSGIYDEDSCHFFDIKDRKPFLAGSDYVRTLRVIGDVNDAKPVELDCPIEDLEIGKLYWFTDYEYEGWRAGVLCAIEDGNLYPFVDYVGRTWKQVKKIHPDEVG